MALPALLAQREFRGVRGRRGLAAHASLPPRLWLDAVLDAHLGCVNHLAWSSDGATLLTSGDDTRLIVWDAVRREKRADVQTGHTANVFCVRPLPGTGDGVVGTCAGDSQVRVHDLRSGGEPRVFDSHVRRVKKLQAEAGNPHLLFSASADSTVRQFDLRCPAAPAPPRRGSVRQAAAEALQAPDVLVAVERGRVELHSLSIPQLRPHLFAVGASDAVTRVYDRRFLAPRGWDTPLAALLPEGVPPDAPGGGVTGVAFSADGGALLASHLHGAVHLFALEQPLGLAGARPAAEAGGAAAEAHAAPQRVQREGPADVAIVLDAVEMAAEAAAARGDLEAARVAVEAALEHVASAKATMAMTAHEASSVESRLRLARAEAFLVAVAHIDPVADGFEARRLGFEALRDAAAAAGIAPREGRARLAVARALHALGHVDEAREQLNVAAALGWSAQLQRLRRQLDRDAAQPQPRSASDAGDSGTESDDDDDDDDDADAEAATAMLELLREARAALLAAPQPPAPPAGSSAGPGASATAVPTLRFEGHRHAATVKDVAFLGDDQDLVASGSDDGRVFIWSRRDASLLCAPPADRSVVNCVQSAPGGGLRLASCGIDSTVKLWAPIGDAEYAARAAGDARAAAAENRARRGADGGRRTVTLAMMHLLRQAQFQPEDIAANVDTT